MPFDEIDDALRRQPMWEPPAGFSRHVAALAVRLPEPSDGAASATSWGLAWHTVAGLLANGHATLSGYAWMVRQYWALLSR